jgi:hypothetical protein
MLGMVAEVIHIILSIVLMIILELNSYYFHYEGREVVG